MKILDLKNNAEYNRIKEAAQTINDGGLVLFPTETVYGLGANGLDKNAVKKIFIAKGRNQDNPLILHISNLEMLDSITSDITDIEYKLIKSFWPGPFTIILNKKDVVPDNVTGGLNTVAVRMPSNIIAKKLIEYAGLPIAAPSANISGKPSGTNLDDILDELKDKVDFIIDGGACEVGLESTVVRVIDNIPHILRPGKITPEQIKQVAGDVIVDNHVLNQLDTSEKPLSPGMKYRHYAPNAKCILVYSKNNTKMVEKIINLANDYKKPLVICCNENAKSYNKFQVLKYGEKNNFDEISKKVFSILRQVDNYNPDIVFIEGVESTGLGLAIMNRLIRACEYNFVQI